MPESDQQKIQRWKQKYYDGLEELESREKQAQQIEHMLRQAVSRLTLVADAEYPLLVKKLDQLRKAIRDGNKTLQLKPLLNDINGDISRLDEARRAQTKQPDTAETLGRLVDDLRVPRSLNKQLRTTRQKLFDSGSSNDPDKLTEEVGQLINAMLAAVQKENEKPADKEAAAEKPGLLKRLLARDAAEEIESEPELKPRSTAGATPEAEPTSPNSIADPTPHSQHDHSAVSPPTIDTRELSAANTAEGYVVAAEYLTQLLERLNLPEELQKDAEEIKLSLHSSPDSFALTTAVVATAELVAVMRGRLEADKMELEAFLKQLTLRLREIDDGLQGSARLHQDSQRDGVQLNDAVSNELSSIEGTLAETHDLKEIKTAVQLRLENMRDHMQSFRATLDMRAENADRQISELTHRLSDVEQEGERLRSQLEAAHNKAIRDPLTGAPNRLAYEERVASELNRFERYQTPFTLMVWDVDHFKKVNDTYGHQAGDKVLKIITDYMSNRIRAVDFIARYGGEEFVVVLPETQKDDAATIAEALRVGIVELNFSYQGSPVAVSASCGLTECRAGDTSVSLFERADKALYQAKQSGRNRITAV